MDFFLNFYVPRSSNCFDHIFLSVVNINLIVLVTFELYGMETSLFTYILYHDVALLNHNQTINDLNSGIYANNSCYRHCCCWGHSVSQTHLAFLVTDNTAQEVPEMMFSASEDSSPDEDMLHELQALENEFDMLDERLLQLP